MPGYISYLEGELSIITIERSNVTTRRCSVTRVTALLGRRLLTTALIVVTLTVTEANIFSDDFGYPPLISFLIRPVPNLQSARYHSRTTFCEIFCYEFTGLPPCYAVDKSVSFSWPSAARSRSTTKVKLVTAATLSMIF